jgi:hypothetical protein
MMSFLQIAPSCTQSYLTMTGAGGGLAAAVHQFHTKHKSPAQMIYNECCGLDDFDDMPISGGLHAMEEKF